MADPFVSVLDVSSSLLFSRFFNETYLGLKKFDAFCKRLTYLCFFFHFFKNGSHI